MRKPEFWKVEEHSFTSRGPAVDHIRQLQAYITHLEQRESREDAELDAAIRVVIDSAERMMLAILRDWRSGNSTPTRSEINVREWVQLQKQSALADGEMKMPQGKLRAALLSMKLMFETVCEVNKENPEGYVAYQEAIAALADGGAKGGTDGNL